MRAIEQNFKNRPHTARFLLAFHSAGAHTIGGAVVREVPVTGENEADLLDLVPATAPAHKPTEGQRKFMADLIDAIAPLDAEAGRKAAAYTLGMSEHEKWTPENVRTWIDNLIAKRDALKAAARTTERPAVADGRYAVEHEGALKFYRVKNGRKPGFVFLDVQASDDLHSIRNPHTIAQVLALIAIDPKAAMIRYGQELGECGHCGRTLTDEASRAAGIGPICAGK